MDIFIHEPSSYSNTPSSGSLPSEDSPLNLANTPNPTQHTASRSSTTNVEGTQPIRKGRKGHSKSRRGCLNCKKARIKCKENRPECDYCAHRGLSCQYPDLQINQISSTLRQATENSFDSQVVRVAPIPVALYEVLPVFTAQDFQLFNLFIEKYYPHHPIGNDKIWKHEIPSIAHNHDFLLHSMLGLSASELACSPGSTVDMNSTALTHRVRAITSLNVAVAEGITSYEQGNAMLATCFNLLFQSCLLEDGFVEYMTFIRGTLTIGIQMGMRRMKFLFDKIFEQEQNEQVNSVITSSPLIQPEVVTAGCRSFERLAPICTEKLEIKVYSILSGIARALITSSKDAYANLRKMYELFSYHMTQSDFVYFCNPNNEVCRILQAHWVALQLIMTPITKAEWSLKEQETGKKDGGDGKTVMWLVSLHKHARAEMRKYYRWTLWVQEEVVNGSLYDATVGQGALERLNDLIEA